MVNLKPREANNILEWPERDRPRGIHCYGLWSLPDTAALISRIRSRTRYQTSGTQKTAKTPRDQKNTLPRHPEASLWISAITFKPPVNSSGSNVNVLGSQTSTAPFGNAGFRAAVASHLAMRTRACRSSLRACHSPHRATMAVPIRPITIDHMARFFSLASMNWL